jgi:hypothetical protein
VKDDYGGEKEEAGRRRVESGMGYKRTRRGQRSANTRGVSFERWISILQPPHRHTGWSAKRQPRNTLTTNERLAFGHGDRGARVRWLGSASQVRRWGRVGWTRPGAPLDGGEFLQPTSTGMQKIRKPPLAPQIALRGGRSNKQGREGATVDERILRQLKARVTCPRARASPSPPRPVVCHKGDGDGYNKDPELWHNATAHWPR